jgi:hypothetical protein
MGQMLVNSHMDSSTMDIYVKQDPDQKQVLSPSGEIMTFSTCKAIVYIPLDHLEGQWVKTKVKEC